MLALSHEGRVLVPRIARADSFRARFMGLMGRRSIDPDEGLFIPRTTSIHMFFMRTPIDCVFLAEAADGGGQRVVALRRRLQPWRGIVWYVRGAHDVLELAPGAIDRAKLVVGDEVRLAVAPAG